MTVSSANFVRTSYEQSNASTAFIMYWGHCKL